MTNLPRLALAGIILAYLIIASLYAISVPLWNAPDEPAHYNYVRQISETLTFPVLQTGDYDAALLERLKSARFPLDEPIDTIRYEGWQPPMYYLAASPVFRLTARLPLTVRVVSLRMVSIIFAALVLVVAYAAVGHILGVWSGVMAAGVIAFVPMWVFIGASVNNDSLGVLVTSTILWFLVHIVSAKTSVQSVHVTWYALTGVLLGIAFVTKSTSYVVAPLIAWAVLTPGPDEKWSRAMFIQGTRRLGLVYGIATLIGGWWFGRNAWIYGGLDVIGKVRHDAVVLGQPTPGALSSSVLFSILETIFHSFWAQFGWMGVVVDRRIYIALFIISTCAALGCFVILARHLRGQAIFTRVQRRTLALFALSAFFTAVALAYYNLSFIQSQGRYLFPALVPLAAYFVIGWKTWIPAMLRPICAVIWIASMATLDVVCLYRFILPDLRP
jgi:4-amino-4-deoxy-L-arabinose transferase-like glycosyltransferase